MGFLCGKHKKLPHKYLLYSNAIPKAIILVTSVYFIYLFPSANVNILPCSLFTDKSVSLLLLETFVLSCVPFC